MTAGAALEVIGENMHQYLKAIGFGDILTKRELKKLIEEIEENYDFQSIVTYSTLLDVTRPLSQKMTGTHFFEKGYLEDFCELQKSFGQGIGISVCGELDEKENFEFNYYYPYFEGSGVTTCVEVVVERRIDKMHYVGICEDPKVGISLIFFLQNGADYISECMAKNVNPHNISVTLSGLALSGKILFPVQKSEEQIRNENKQADIRKRLVHAARNGDPNAIETLTLDDMDLYTQVSHRLVDEDVFSIVDTYIMPYGVECDVYSIMGEILAFRERENTKTKEILCQMKLDVNGLQFDICVPKARLLGEPEIGRRFKGTIWLQGFINY